MSENTEPTENIENNNQINLPIDNDITEDNLIYKIWIKPTTTLAYILKNCPDKFMVPLMILGGITRAIDRASTQNMGDKYSIFYILIITIVAGGLFGWISYYFYAWLLEITGKWLKGKADYEEFKTVIAWSLIPSICSLVLLIPEILIFGVDIFKSDMSDTGVVSIMLMVLFGLVEITLGIWTLIIFVKGVSLIQNFNTWKAILNMILPVFLILIPILFIVLIFKMFI